MIATPQYTFTKTFHLNLATRAADEHGARRPAPLEVEVTCAGCYLGSDGRLAPDPTFAAFSEYLHSRFGRRLEDALPQPTVERIAFHLFQWLDTACDEASPVLRVRVKEFTINPQSATYGYP